MEENMKKCSKCLIFKTFSEFNSKKDSKDGLYPFCKICRAIRGKEYIGENQDTIKSQRKQYRINNKKKIADGDRKYREENEDKLREKNKEYYINNREILIKKNSDYTKKKRKESIQMRISDALRNRVRAVIKENIAGSAVKDLGCPVEELKQYLENKFYTNPKTGEQMTWGNYSFYGWHIDHIMPLSSFDLTNREQFLQACHYTNLQPLWAEENLRKSDKIIK